MGVWIVVLVFLTAGLCLSKGCRRRFLRDVWWLLCLPVTTFVSLVKKCK